MWFVLKVALNMAEEQHLTETEKQRVAEMFRKNQRKIDIAKVFDENRHYHKNCKMISRI